MVFIRTGRPWSEGWTEPQPPKVNLLAVDPGDIHVGVAFFECDETRQEDPTAWECIDTQEMTPVEFEDALIQSILDGDIDILVFERYLLDPTKLEAQINSELRTAQLIGVIRYLHRMQMIHVRNHERARKTGALLQCEQVGWSCHDPKRRSYAPILLVGQTSSILKPTRGIMRAKGVKSTAKRNGDKLGHQLAAELHGLHWIHYGQFHATPDANNVAYPTTTPPPKEPK